MLNLMLPGARPLLFATALLPLLAAPVAAAPSSPGPLAPGAAPAATSTKKEKKRITLDLQDAEIRNVLRLLADVGGVNLVVSDDVKGKVTVKLKNVPWDQALDVVLQSKGLDKVVEGNILRVAPADVIFAEQRRKLDAADECLKHGPLKTKIVPVSYARAQELVPLVQGLLSERGKVTFDERTNVLIIKDVSCGQVFRRF